MTARRTRSTLGPKLFDALPPLTDEAAAIVVQFFADLHLALESRYLAQIQRDRQAKRSPPRNPNQPWLTGIPGADEPF